MDKIINFLLELLISKALANSDRVKVAIVGAVLAVAAKWGLPQDVSAWAANAIAGLAGTLILGISHRDVLPPLPPEVEKL